MKDAGYITNNEIAAFMDGYLNGAGKRTVADAADAAVAYYSKTAMVTYSEALTYYAAYAMRKEA